MKYQNTTLRLAASAFALVALSAGAAFAQGPGGPPGGGGMIDRIMAMDTNHAGAISAAELTAGREAQFTRMDANHDGFISQDEIPQFGGGGPPGGAPSGPLGMFQQADTNGDGKISHAEYMAAPSRMAQRLDTNHDGAISADEIAAARAAMGGN